LMTIAVRSRRSSSVAASSGARSRCSCGSRRGLRTRGGDVHAWVGTLTPAGLCAEIGEFGRFSHPE
jgi:hypothetical protein